MDEILSVKLEPLEPLELLDLLEPVDPLESMEPTEHLIDPNNFGGFKLDDPSAIEDTAEDTKGNVIGNAL